MGRERPHLRGVASRGASPELGNYVRTRSGLMDSVFVGINLPSKHSDSSLGSTLDLGYDFVTARITTRAYRRKVQALYPTSEPDSMQESVLVPQPADDDLAFPPDSKIAASTVALAAPWAELDSRNDVVADASLQVLQHEVTYARFCGISFVVIPGPRRRTHISRYAHAVAGLLRSAPNLKLLVHTPCTEEFSADGQPPQDLLSIWQVWDAVRSICDYPENLRLALELGPHVLPDTLVDRWFCENVAMLILSATTVFLSNQNGYPVLAKHTQSLLQKFIQEPNTFILIKDLSEPQNDGCLTYLQHLAAGKPELTTQQAYSEGYDDILEKPLQPLSENLENDTYEVFEQDAVKYRLYAQAIDDAMRTTLKDVPELVVIVAGAGRGPLIDRVLAAASRLDRTVHVHAVEKNPGAVSLLKHRQRTQWGDTVHIHMSDMREWAAPYQAHLIVSELLGSFGDNELGPECLKSLESALLPDGVMIPNAYVSWIEPTYSPRLYMQARKLKSCECPHVVKPLKAQSLAETQAVWGFVHPYNVSGPRALKRSAHITFTIQKSGTVHGFTGYFEAQLFGDIELSTHPSFQSEKSPNLLSWFPMWFPLSVPLVVSKNSEVELNIWRQCDQTRVWYEWSVETYRRENSRRTFQGATAIHNLNGSAFSVSKVI